MRHLAWSKTMETCTICTLRKPARVCKLLGIRSLAEFPGVRFKKKTTEVHDLDALVQHYAQPTQTDLPIPLAF